MMWLTINGSSKGLRVYELHFGLHRERSWIPRAMPGLPLALQKAPAGTGCCCLWSAHLSFTDVLEVLTVTACPQSLEQVFSRVSEESCNNGRESYSLQLCMKRWRCRGRPLLFCAITHFLAPITPGGSCNGCFSNTQIVLGYRDMVAARCALSEQPQNFCVELMKHCKASAVKQNMAFSLDRVPWQAQERAAVEGMSRLAQVPWNNTSAGFTGGKICPLFCTKRFNLVCLSSIMDDSLGMEGHMQLYQELQRSSSSLRPNSWAVTEPGRGKWDSPFWLRCARISKSHGCKNHESCSVPPLPWQGQSQPPLSLTLQAVTGALTENAVIPELSSTSSEPFPAPSLPRCLPHFRETSHLLYLFLLYKIHELKTLYISSMVSSPVHQAGISLLLVLCPFLGKDTQQTLKNNFTFSFYFFKRGISCFW